LYVKDRDYNPHSNISVVEKDPSKTAALKTKVAEVSNILLITLSNESVDSKESRRTKEH
jgi:hypothetical protein